MLIFRLCWLPLFLLLAALPLRVYAQHSDARQLIRQAAKAAAREDEKGLMLTYEILRRVNEPELRAAAIDGLRDRNPSVRRFCVEILGEATTPLPPERIPALLRDPHLGVREASRQYVSAHPDPAAVDTLLKMLGERKYAGERGEIIDALGATGDPRIVQPLAQLGERKDSARYRYHIIRGLGNVQDPAVVEVLLRWFDDEKMDERSAIIDALARFDDPRIVPAIVRHLDDRTVASAGGEYLAAHVEQALPLLTAAFQEAGENAETRRNITIALAALRDPRALAALTTAARDPHDLTRVTAWNGLYSLGDAGIDALLPQFTDPDPEVRLGLVGVFLFRRTDNPRLLNALFAACSDEDAGVRWSALRALANSRDPRLVEISFALAGDADASVRREALQHIAGQPGDRASKVLIAALGDADEGIRAAAAGYLGERRDPRTADALLDLARKPDAPFSALAALATLRDPRVIPLLIPRLEPEDEADFFFPSYQMDTAAKALAYLGAAAYEPLTGALRHPDPTIRAGAATALGLMGDIRAFEPLRAALNDADPIVRRNAVVALYYFLDERTVPWLLAMLQDKDVRVRKAAADALAAFVDPRMVAPLLRAAADPKSGIETEAFDALRRFDDPRVVDFMVKALNDKNRYALAVKGGPWAKDPRAQKRLFQLLQHKEEDIREAAAGALVKLADPAVVSQLAALHPADPDVACNVFIALAVSRGPGVKTALLSLLPRASANLNPVPASELLAPCFDAGDLPLLREQLDQALIPEHRALLLYLIGRIGGSEAAPILLQEVEHGRPYDPEVESDPPALLALVFTRDPRAVEPLLAYLREEPRVIQSIATMLADFNDPRVADALLAMLQDETAARFAAQGLAELREPRTVEPLIALWRTPGARSRFMAPYVLAQIGDPRAMPVLLEALVERPGLLSAIEGLGRIGTPEAGDILLGMLERELNRVTDVPQSVSIARIVELSFGVLSTTFQRTAVVKALGAMKERRAVPMLCDALTLYDPFTVTAAATALGEIGDPAAAEALFAQLGRGPMEQSEMHELRNAVADALGHLKDERMRLRLREITASDNWRLRAGAARVMGTMGEPWAVTTLIGQLRDPNARVRAAAVQALQAIGDPRAVEPLRALQADPYLEIRTLAREAVETLTRSEASSEVR